jgi:hypothetical protein
VWGFNVVRNGTIMKLLIKGGMINYMINRERVKYRHTKYTDRGRLGPVSDIKDLPNDDEEEYTKG